MRKSDHETRFCGRIGGGLRRRIYSQLCPWRLWAWRRISWRLRAQSYDTPGIASTADAGFSKPDSGPARGTCAAARHQRAVGAEPIWRGYVARVASFDVVRDHERIFLAFDLIELNGDDLRRDPLGAAKPHT